MGLLFAGYKYRLNEMKKETLNSYEHFCRRGYSYSADAIKAAFCD
jgi:hypothetical protein